MTESKSQPSESDGVSREERNDSRRKFIKKLTYAAPVLTTYFLDETAFAKDKDKDKKDKKTSPHPPPGRGRGRG